MSGKEPWVFKDSNRVRAITHALGEIHGKGTLNYHGLQFGWIRNNASPEEPWVAFSCVDYSLQDIGGPDDEVQVFNDDESIRHSFPAGTFPPMTLLPRSQMVINARFIEGLTDDPR